MRNVRSAGVVVPLSFAGKLTLGKLAFGALFMGGIPLALFVVCLYVGAMSGERLPRG